jgi:hypothetical protein
MASPSEFGRAGIGIRDCTLPGRELRLASALALATSPVLAGVGTTGDMTGITTASPSTSTATFPTAESSPIAIPSITPVQAADFVVEMDFKAAALAEIGDSMDQSRMDLPLRNMASRRRMSNLAVIPARSEALITEALREGFPLAGSRASAAEEVSTAAAAFMVAEATGNPV